MGVLSELALNVLPHQSLLIPVEFLGPLSQHLEADRHAHEQVHSKKLEHVRSPKDTCVVFYERNDGAEYEANGHENADDHFSAWFCQLILLHEEHEEKGNDIESEEDGDTYNLPCKPPRPVLLLTSRETEREQPTLAEDDKDPVNIVLYELEEIGLILLHGAIASTLSQRPEREASREDQEEEHAKDACEEYQDLDQEHSRLLGVVFDESSILRVSGADSSQILIARVEMSTHQELSIADAAEVNERLKQN